MTEEMGSTVPRRQLGRTLKQLRTEAGVTLDAAASALECSRQKVWRIESGLGVVRSLDVRVMCRLYDVRPDLVTALVGLASQTKAKGWWHAYGDAIPEWFELYVGLESAASRLQRQSLLTRRLPPAPRLEVVIHEAALLRTVGSSAAMAEQLCHLIEVTDLPSTSIRVLPLSAGLHRGVEAGTFVMLDFPPGNRNTPEPPVIYSESWTRALYLDRPEEVAAYETIWDGLNALAFDEGQSKQLINKIIGEVHRG